MNKQYTPKYNFKRGENPLHNSEFRGDLEQIVNREVTKDDDIYKLFKRLCYYIPNHVERTPLYFEIVNIVGSYDSWLTRETGENI